MGAPARVNVARGATLGRGSGGCIVAEIRPYGSWSSPVTAASLAEGAIGVAELRVADGRLYWLETRPAEGGRLVVMTRDPGGEVRQLTPEGFNVRTRVHEYGGGSYVVAPDGLWFANFRDQKLYRQAGDAAPEPRTPEGYRFADAVPTPGGGLIAVREDHTDPANVKNAVVRLPADGRRGRSAVRRERLRRLPARQPGRQAAGLDRLGLPGHAVGRDAPLRRRPDRDRPRQRPPGRRRRRRLGHRAAVGRAWPAHLDLRRDRLVEPLRRREPGRRAARPPELRGRVRRAALDAGPIQLCPDRRRSAAGRRGRDLRRPPAVADRPGRRDAAPVRPAVPGLPFAAEAGRHPCRHAGRLGERDRRAHRRRHRDRRLRADPPAVAGRAR